MNQNTRDNNKSGYLYINKQKTAEKQPDWRGKVTINGVEFLISGWERLQNGDKMISLKVTDPKDLPAAGGNTKGQNYSANASSDGKASGRSVSAPSTGNGYAGKPPVQDNIPDLDDLDSLFDGN